MTMVARISLWLRQISGAYCDACIAEELGLSRRRANYITNVLSRTANFYREQGVCSLCAAAKKVIESV
jgi:hypothetical protein